MKYFIVLSFIFYVCHSGYTSIGEICPSDKTVKLPKQDLTLDWDLAEAFTNSQKILGRGGMGEVREVPANPLLNQKNSVVAVKQVKSETVVMAELDTSVEFAGVIGPQFYGCQLDPSKNLLYIAQEILFTPLDSKGFRDKYLLMSNRQKMELIENILKQIIKFWELGYMHKDIHRGNVMLDAAGNPRLIDFGTATLVNSKRQKVGTRSFMAPDQRKEVGTNQEKDDIYSLFVMFGMLERRRTIDAYLNSGSPAKHRLAPLFTKLGVNGDADQTLNSLLYMGNNPKNEKCPISDDKSYDKCRAVLLSNIISELSFNGFGVIKATNKKPLTTCTSSITNLAYCVLEYDHLTLTMAEIKDAFETLTRTFRSLI